MNVTTPAKPPLAGKGFCSTLARQPIVDRSGRLYGYELLFRGVRESDRGLDGGTATASVLVAAACDIGWESLGGGRPLFLNVGTTMIFDSAVEMAPPALTVLEVLEDIEVDDRVEGRARALRSLGFSVALDDFVEGSSAERLLPIADVVKIDVLTTPADRLPQLVARLHRAGVLVVAEKVEDAEVHERCFAAGFDLFQGYWYARPALQRTSHLSPQRVVCLRLLAALLHDEPDIAHIESLVCSDVAIVVRTMGMANSAASGTGRVVKSVRQAVVLVGPKTLAGWIALMLMSQDADDGALQGTEVLVRARTCEMLTASRSGSAGGPAFLAGLVSGLSDLMGAEPGPLLDVIGAADEVRDAVLGREGNPLAQIVREVADHLGGSADAPTDVQLAHLAALAWVGQLQSAT